MITKIDEKIQSVTNKTRYWAPIPYVLSVIGAMLAFLLPGVAILTGPSESPIFITVGLVLLIMWGYCTINPFVKRVFMVSDDDTFSRPWFLLWGIGTIVIGHTTTNVVVGIGLWMLSFAAYMWKSNNRKEG